MSPTQKKALKKAGLPLNRLFLSDYFEKGNCEMQAQQNVSSSAMQQDKAVKEYFAPKTASLGESEKPLRENEAE
jgi:hypothetical protein